jgi:NAD(P)-dependent dehydrogenase (short-subunit alcohol dehydrogenase family)
MFRGVIPKGDPREQSLAAAIPMKRLGRVDDVARTVMFFADRDNDFVTGQTLYVCGGASLGSLPI